MTDSISDDGDPESRNARRLRIMVIGRQGQVARAIIERAERLNVEIIPMGRPELDLAKTETVFPALARVRADAIINAAAYTAVDQAENEEELAYRINAIGVGEVASVANSLGIPLVHLSTDYIFDGEKSEPYLEIDRPNPQNIYGKSKLAGEQEILIGTSNHAILRTAWVYSPFGRNFVRTILHAAKTSDQLRIVSDQRGSPTSAFDIADGAITVTRNLVARPEDPTLRGIFHMTSAGDTTWASFGIAIFAASLSVGGPSVPVQYISSANYPRPAKRPMNSRLNCSKIAATHGVRLPDWRRSLKFCIETIVHTDFARDKI